MNICDLVSPSFKIECRAILEEYNDHPLFGDVSIDITQDVLSQYARLIRKGLIYLPDIDPEIEPVYATATFFLIISELSEIPEDWRDFALDTMLFCEGSTAESPRLTKNSIRLLFETIINDYSPAKPLQKDSPPM